jgi:hypothetical protein
MQVDSSTLLAAIGHAVPETQAADGVTSPTGPTSAAGRRRRIAARTRVDFWFDAVLFVGYTLAYSYSFTGIGIHEWLGIGLGVALLLHITLHWDWVIRTTKRMLDPRGHDKIIWVVNVALLLGMTMCVLSGVLISRVALPFLGITPLGGPFWTRLHDLTAEVTLGLVPVHAALRWRWIVQVGRRLLAWPAARRSR